MVQSSSLAPQQADFSGELLTKRRCLQKKKNVKFSNKRWSDPLGNRIAFCVKIEIASTEFKKNYMKNLIRIQFVAPDDSRLTFRPVLSLNPHQCISAKVVRLKVTYTQLSKV